MSDLVSQQLEKELGTGVYCPTEGADAVAPIGRGGTAQIEEEQDEQRSNVRGS